VDPSSQGEGVELSFNEDSLKAIARLAIKRGSGARGLRSILEEILLSTMYELPEQSGLQRVVIDGDVVAKKKDPIRVYESIKKTA
jgi:ATP-dependent Clp protease ATP-binding subunit ClpX